MYLIGICPSSLISWIMIVSSTATLTAAEEVFQLDLGTEVKPFTAMP